MARMALRQESDAADAELQHLQYHPRQYTTHNSGQDACCCCYVTERHVWHELERTCSVCSCLSAGPFMNPKGQDSSMYMTHRVRDSLSEAECVCSKFWICQLQYYMTNLVHIRHNMRCTILRR